ncbi:MAG: ComF family protein [Firmicutes bacterium]|nr:ComF family protein [Bacillota bacterium]
MELKTILKRMLYPQRCLLCDQIVDAQQSIPLCRQCHPEQFLPTGPRCIVCSRPVEEEGERCSGCREHKNVTTGRSTFLYDGAMRESIQQFKFGGMKDYAPGYAKLMMVYDQDWFSNLGTFFLVPVPIHQKRLRERGYNQAAEVARQLGRFLNVPVWEGLKRSVNTDPLKQMSARARRESLKGAFIIEETASMPKGTAVLVDDIYTSGSTVEKCAAALKGAVPDLDICFWSITIRP